MKGASLQRRAWPKSLLAGKRRRPALLGVMRTLPSASKNCSLRVALATRATGGGPNTSITHCICSASFSPDTPHHQHPSLLASSATQHATIGFVMVDWVDYPTCLLTTCTHYQLGPRPTLALRRCWQRCFASQSTNTSMPEHCEPIQNCTCPHAYALPL